ncbi:MAG: FtsQ-type POTRA domain-containing protein [Clostridia bacterium]|nr:FtsQ-type POTRA domain-containing protein [Clostridia bacterium]
MKKSKGQTVDLLYTKKQEPKKTKSVGTTSRRDQKNKKNRKENTRISKNETINLDNEIIIGLTPKKQTTNKKTTKNSKNKTKNVGATSSRPHKNSKIKKNKNTKKTLKTTKKNKIAKYIILIFLIIVAIIMFMMSSLFNIKQIIVVNNSKISSEEIIILSQLVLDTNMFKVTNENINQNIKTNSYIESVKMKRNLNGTVTLEIQERTPTYMLQFGNSYVYINNQGYILEITEEPLNIPILTGFETTPEEIKEGNRLVVNDLKKLEDIIKIMESSKSNSLAGIITNIDISDKQNYKLLIPSENKIINFGDIKNINIKILKIEEVIEQEKGISGEIYFQDSEKTVFRETVNF